MNLRELVRVSLISLKGSKLRSLLTTLGITIGIAAVIAVVAIGQGGRAALNSEMEKMGTNLFVVYIDGVVHPGDMQMVDIQIIKAAAPQVKYLAPSQDLVMQVQGPRGGSELQITGTTSDFAQVRNLAMQTGRFISEEDQDSLRRVIVLDGNAARELFGSLNPLGQQVNISGNSAVVIGVIETNPSLFGSSMNSAYIPISFSNSIRGDDTIYQMWGSAASKASVEEAMNGAVKILERRHQAADHYKSESMLSSMQEVNQVTSIISLIVSSIAGISLVVGGIGVMNIMLVSVTERTREIGIRMALGARRRDILIQFLVEAVVLCLLGGILGTAIGYSGAWLVAHFAKWPPLVSWTTVALAFGFSAGVGLIFGVYPANRAARLDPIVALHRD
ncbi:MAG: ABC transporter permease [Syntrophomonadaceae bacterium]|nr:ABC transporter permease [Syntrophomonadaceae bacterium]